VTIRGFDPTVDQEVRPWDRMPGEGPKAYEAFVTYRDMGVSRTARKSAEQLGKSAGTIWRWSGRWHWIERAQAWDRYLDVQYARELVTQRREMAKQHARISQAMEGRIVNRLAELRPEELTPGDLARWLDIAVKVRRQSLGLSGDTVAVEHSGEVTTNDDVSYVTRRILADPAASAAALDALELAFGGDRRPSATEPSAPGPGGDEE